jgi:hypothetical protein
MPQISHNSAFQTIPRPHKTASLTGVFLVLLQHFALFRQRMEKMLISRQHDLNAAKLHLSDYTNQFPLSVLVFKLS